MKIPAGLKILAVVLATTGAYTYLGHWVPQKEVYPPAEIALSTDMSPEALAENGKKIAADKGLCLTCHTIGQSGILRFPDLAGIGGRAASIIPGMSDIEYFAQSMYEPNHYIVPGFNPGMPMAHKPPIAMTDQEILAVIAFLQSLGGTPTVTLATQHAYNGGGGTQPASQSPSVAVSKADEGRALYDKYDCAKCHNLDTPEKGKKAGPSLYGVGQRLSNAQIFVAILYPDRASADPADIDKMEKGLEKKEFPVRHAQPESADAGKTNGHDPVLDLLVENATLQQVQALVEFLTQPEDLTP